MLSWQHPAFGWLAALAPLAAWLAWRARRGVTVAVSSLLVWRQIAPAGRRRRVGPEVAAAAAIPLLVAVALAGPRFSTEPDPAAAGIGQPEADGRETPEASHPSEVFGGPARTFRMDPRLDERTDGCLALALRLAGESMQEPWEGPGPAWMTVTDDPLWLRRGPRPEDGPDAVLWLFAPLIPDKADGDGSTMPAPLSDRPARGRLWPGLEFGEPELWLGLPPVEFFPVDGPEALGGGEVWAWAAGPDGQPLSFAAHWDGPAPGRDGGWARVAYWGGWDGAWASRPEFAALVAETAGLLAVAACSPETGAGESEASAGAEDRAGTAVWLALAAAACLAAWLAWRGR